MSLGLTLSTALAYRRLPAPTLRYTFAGASALPGGMTFTRSGNESCRNSSGTIVVTGTDVPNFHYDASLLPAGLLVQPARTNSIRNNTMVGAVAGTPGTAPTNWTVSGSGNGLTRTITLGSDGGLSYIGIQYAGTPTSGTNVQIAFEAANTIAALPSQDWSMSSFVRLAAGTLANTSPSLNLLATNGTSGVTGGLDLAIAPTSANLSLQRFSISSALGSTASITNVQPRVRIGYTVGLAIDFTFWIALPQPELASFGTTAIATSTTAVTRNVDVATTTLTQTSDILVQDRSGGAWITGVPAGSYSIVPRTGQGVIAAWAAYPAGTAAAHPGMAVAYS